MTSRPKPTESELEILQLLWKNGPATVRTINDQLNQKRDIGYTTSLKIMQIMHEKGMLTREPKGRSHIYHVVYQEQETQKVLLDKFLETAFGGSAMKMVMQALGNRKSSKTELQQIRNLLDSMEDSQ